MIVDKNKSIKSVESIKSIGWQIKDIGEEIAGIVAKFRNEFGRKTEEEHNLNKKIEFLNTLKPEQKVERQKLEREIEILKQEILNKLEAQRRDFKNKITQKLNELSGTTNSIQTFLKDV